MSNEYKLYNGEVIDVNPDTLKAMMVNGMIQVPSFLELVGFDNLARFAGDVISVHNRPDINNDYIVSINYGNSYSVLQKRDTYFEYYHPYLHKNYPLVVHGELLLKEGRRELHVNDRTTVEDCGDYCRTMTGIDEGIHEHQSTVKVRVIRHNEISKFVKITKTKQNHLGEITAMDLVGYSKEEIELLRKAGLLDNCYAMYEMWTNPKEIPEDYKKEAEADATLHDEQEGKYSDTDIDIPAPLSQEALTGHNTMYELEIDCAALGIEKNCAIIFEEIFRDTMNIKDVVSNDDYGYKDMMMDMYHDSDVIKAIFDKTYNISTSLLLTQVEPEKDGFARFTVANKLINDFGTDYGWYY
jgi:hypothetical protein